jgi:lipopolysaccharide transport protein LptA
MAATHPDPHAVPKGLRRLAVAAILAAAPSLPVAEAAQAAQTAQTAQTAKPAKPAKPAQGRNAEIVLDAASSDVDYRSNTLLFRDVVITQGPLRVQAERARATGLDFKDATWTFSGKVRIDVEGGTLRSDEAVVNFVANQLARATVRGKPAEFEQRLKTGGKAQGRAGSLLYETRNGTVTLREGAWLSDGRSEIRGQQLVYDIAAQRVQAGKTTGSDERVRIVIRPQSGTDSKTPTEPRPPPDPQGKPPAPQGNP